jgi:hypothetical protein
MRITRHLIVGLVFGGLLASAAAAEGQPLGTYRWQQEPYCNVITLNVVQSGGVYQVDGYDDQCGAGQRAAAIGTAFQNPDGSIGMGLVIVTSGGLSIHLDTVLSLSTLSGFWADGSTSGNWVFRPGPAHQGSPRPVAAATIFIEGPGKSIPASFSSLSFLTALNETVITPRAGRLAISKSLHRASILCNGLLGAGYFVITVDGVPIRNSVLYNDFTILFTGFLHGVTLAPVAAGSHVISFGVHCLQPGQVADAIFLAPSISSVTLTP